MSLLEKVQNNWQWIALLILFVLSNVAAAIVIGINLIEFFDGFSWWEEVLGWIFVVAHGGIAIFAVVAVFLWQWARNKVLMIIGVIVFNLIAAAILVYHWYQFTESFDFSLNRPVYQQTTMIFIVFHIIFILIGLFIVIYPWYINRYLERGVSKDIEFKEEDEEELAEMDSEKDKAMAEQREKERQARIKEREERSAKTREKEDERIRQEEVRRAEEEASKEAARRKIEEEREAEIEKARKKAEEAKEKELEAEREAKKREDALAEKYKRDYKQLQSLIYS